MAAFARTRRHRNGPRAPEKKVAAFDKRGYGATAIRRSCRLSIAASCAGEIDRPTGRTTFRENRGRRGTLRSGTIELPSRTVNEFFACRGDFMSDATLDDARGTRLTAEETARRGDAFYIKLREQLESADRGRIVAIDVHSGDYEVDETVLAACRRLRTRRPEAEIWSVRIGSPGVHRIGRTPKEAAL